MHQRLKFVLIEKLFGRSKSERQRKYNDYIESGVSSIMKNIQDSGSLLRSLDFNDSGENTLYKL